MATSAIIILNGKRKFILSLIQTSKLSMIRKGIKEGGMRKAIYLGLVILQKLDSHIYTLNLHSNLILT